MSVVSPTDMYWKTSRREIEFTRPLVMGILNVTPDSFFDGGKFASVDSAIKHAAKLVADGADIIDIGGESTRPGSARVSVDEETSRVVPVIEAVTARLDIPISIDTTKSAVARAGAEAGAEIINDISGLRFDEQIAAVAAEYHAGLVLMHSRGEFATMHSQPPVDVIIADVTADLHRSISVALTYGVAQDRIALDIGIGFGKTLDQNLELLAKLDKLVIEFEQFPILVGTSRKSFIGKLLDGEAPDQRLNGSIASIAIAVWHGAKILRVHDVRETRQAAKIAYELRRMKL